MATHDQHHQAPYGTGRISPQRREIVQVAGALPGAFTVDDLLRAMAEASAAVGAATVYRAVAALAETGWLQRVGERAGVALYVRCSGGAHHHHLICTECGRVARTACPLDDSTSAWAKETGFSITHHDVTLYGVCADCRAGTPGGDS